MGYCYDVYLPMTILIVLILSGWDANYVSHKAIGAYETPALCEAARERLNNYIGTQRYLCVKEVK